MEGAVSQACKAAAFASAEELESRLTATERKPITAVSNSDLIALNDQAIKCGADLLRLRASVFLEQRNHDAAVVQAAADYQKETAAATEQSKQQKDVALREYYSTRDSITRKAKEDYEDLCKLYRAKKPDFEARKVEMPKVRDFSDLKAASEAGISIEQAVYEWEKWRMVPDPEIAIYAVIYVIISSILAAMLDSLVGGFLIGILPPAVLFFLSAKAYRKLHNLAPALARDGARIAKRMEQPIEAARKSLTAREDELDAALEKTLKDLKDRRAKAMETLRSDHEALMSDLRQTAHSLDARMLGLLDRLKRLESTWQMENRQSVMVFSEKPLDWKEPAPRLLRLGNLSLTSGDLILQASQSEIG